MSTIDPSASPTPAPSPLLAPEEQDRLALILGRDPAPAELRCLAETWDEFLRERTPLPVPTTAAPATPSAPPEIPAPADPASALRTLLAAAGADQGVQCRPAEAPDGGPVFAVLLGGQTLPPGLDAWEAGKLAASQAAGELACAGARLLAASVRVPDEATPDPRRERWIGGLLEACRAFRIPAAWTGLPPVNPEPKTALGPLAEAVMVGLVEVAGRMPSRFFQAEGDAILLLGAGGDGGDPVQAADFHLTLRALALSGSIRSARLCGAGGLALALARSCLRLAPTGAEASPIGVKVDLSSPATAGPGAGAEASLFAGMTGCAVVTVAAVDAVKVVERAKLLGTPARKIGAVGGELFQVKTAGAEWSLPVASLGV